jgi:hypothetical protein
MAAENSFVDWPGSAGIKLRFWFVDLSLARLIRQPGVYIFVRLTNQGWLPVYIGIADDLVDRLTNHDRWAEAQRLGATHLMAKGLADRAAREAMERHLIGLYNPPLNTQHRTDRKVG